MKFSSSGLQAPKKFAQQLADLRAERDKYWEQSQAAREMDPLSGAGGHLPSGELT